MKFSKLFNDANQLWFHQGRTAQAVSAYQQAMQADPTNPAIIFQNARVLWSLDRFDEARFLIEQAQAFNYKLNPLGKMALHQWDSQLRQIPPKVYFAQWLPTQLDRDVLESGAILVNDWREIADAANAREMYGLALYALDRWGGHPNDSEDVREIGQIETNRDNDEAMLIQMYASKTFVENSGNITKTIPSKANKQPNSTAQKHIPNINAPGSSAGETPISYLPDLPLSLLTWVSPTSGKIGERMTLVAKLSNPTEDAVIVNSRFLINHRRSPGEIWLDVQGPTGYCNTLGFRVRPGETPAQFFVTLEPGQSIEQSWLLNEYHSLDRSGEYQLIITYHNECKETPGGRSMAVGQVVGRTEVILN